MSDQLHLGELGKTILPWLNHTSKCFTYHIMRKLKENGIDSSREQMMILKNLSAQDGQVQGDLAFITNRDKTSLTRIVNSMQKKGLVKRVQCEKDHRCNKIYISKEGKALFKKGYPIVVDTVRSVQKNISEAEIEASMTVLQKILGNLNDLENKS